VLVECDDVVEMRQRNAPLARTAIAIPKQVGYGRFFQPQLACARLP